MWIDGHQGIVEVKRTISTNSIEDPEKGQNSSLFMFTYRFISYEFNYMTMRFEPIIFDTKKSGRKLH